MVPERSRRVILEIGCGTGRNLPGFMKSGHRVYAIDFDFDAVSTAQSILLEEKIPGVFFATAKAQALPFTEAAFDEVHCIDVLHWASDAEEFESMWMEAWRVLKPGGIFFATLRTESQDAKWFHANPVLIETLVEKCKGEWLRRSDAILELKK